MICKSFKEKEKLRRAGRSAATILDRLCSMVKPGMNTLELDEEGGGLMKDFGVKSACKGYRSGHRIFPSFTCLSVNDEVVHGIGVENRILKEGDIISVDVCIREDGMIGDNCRTIAVGTVSPEIEKLLKVTEESLYAGISQALHKNRVGDVSEAVQDHIESSGFAVITNFVGHGVGRSLHEDPQIPNFGKSGTGPKFRKGMAICIEPMVNMRSSQIRMAKDGWTAMAVDGMPSAHFEHTLLVDDEYPEILTIPDGYENAEDFLSQRTKQVAKL
ncbi:MAG: type I methionyl aminopeptidase [Opitutae bacterium]|nr:type I methionyl aminopeptidase [Opitutae bacterium]